MRAKLLTAIALGGVVAVSTATATPPGAERLVINLTGDVGYPRQFDRGEEIDRRQQGLFEQVQPIVDSAQLNFTNLECPFTRRLPSVPDMWPLSCPTKKPAIYTEMAGQEKAVRGSKRCRVTRVSPVSEHGFRGQSLFLYFFGR